MLKRRHSDPGAHAPRPKIRFASCCSACSTPPIMPYEQPPTKKCFFLDSIPPEIRLQIYEYLVVANEPLKGRQARNKARSGLSLPILRVNSQIHNEAQELFFAKNTFYISSMPEDDTNPKITDKPHTLLPEERRFEPPLLPARWPSLRNLVVDLIYYPKSASSLHSTSNDNSYYDNPSDTGAAAYIHLLTHLLTITALHLQTFALTASISATSHARSSLLTFFLCDRNAPFLHALSLLHPHLPTIPLRFEFPDCFYRVNVVPGVFVRKSILLLACQVMFCQSRVRVERLMEDFEGERGGVGGVEEGKGEGSREARVDLGPFIRGYWPRQEGLGGTLGMGGKADWA